MSKGGGGGSQVTGYKYFFDFLMGICRGSIDQLVALRAGDLPLWSGTEGGNNTIRVDKANLFGGDKGEGGIVGDITLLMGADGQVVPANIKNAIAGGTTATNEGTWTFSAGVGTSDQGATAEIAADISNFIGVTTLYYSGQIASNNPYPKTWKARARRALRGWGPNGCWYPDKAIVSYSPQIASSSLGGWNATANLPALTSGIGIDGTSYNVSVAGGTLIDGVNSWAVGDMIVFSGGTSKWIKLTSGETVIKAMNPAHMLYQCLTDRSWGRGMDRAELDDAAWTYAANYLLNETFGLCIRWAKDGDINDFIQSIIDHIGAALYIDRGTGLMVLRLIRNDYDYAKLPLFDYNSGLLSVDTEETGASTITANEVVIKWHDPIRDQDRQTRVHNLASMQSLGYPISITRDFPGIPDPDLAQRVALRELQVGSAGVKRMKARFDRRAWRIQPGMVLRISAPDKGITDIVMRVATYDDGTMIDGTITMDLLQDVFGMPSTVYTTPVNNATSDVVRGQALPIVYERVEEAAYRTMLRSMSSTAFDAVTDAEGGIASSAGRPNAISKYFSVQATPSGGVAVEGGGAYAPYGIVGTAMGYYDINLFLAGGADLASLTVGMSGVLGGELVQVVSVTPASGLIVVSRGGGDTVPVPHAIGEAVIFNDDRFGAASPDIYSSAESVDVVLLNHTSTATSDATQAIPHNIVIAARHFMPYVMGNLRLNGSPALSADYLGVTGNAVFTWAARNRLLQADQFVAHGDGAVTAEASTTYTVEVRNGLTDALIRTHTGISASTYTYDATEKASGAPDPVLLTLVFYADRAGTRSYSEYRVKLAYVATGEGVGQAAGTSSAHAVGSGFVAGAGTAAGTGAAAGRGVMVGIAATVGHAVGIGGTLSRPVYGNAMGVGAAAAVSNSHGFISIDGHAAGVGAANAGHVSTGTLRGTGAAAGHGAVAGVGAHTQSSPGSAAGVGAATANGLIIGVVPTTGVTNGVGAASGVKLIVPTLHLSGSGIASTTTTVHGTVTTTAANEVVIFSVFAEIADALASPPTFTVSGGGLTWTRRARQSSVRTDRNTAATLDVWSAPAPTVLTGATITATASATFDDAACVWFGVYGVGSTTRPFDPHPILPVTATYAGPDYDNSQPSSNFYTAQGDRGGDFVFTVIGTSRFDLDPSGSPGDPADGQTHLVTVLNDGAINWAGMTVLYRNDSTRDYDQPFGITNFVSNWISVVDALTADPLTNTGGALARGAAAGGGAAIVLAAGAATGAGAANGIKF